MKVLGVIPARFGSSRFPGKPLVSIHGKPMIQCVYEQASKAQEISHLVVATDNDDIYRTVEGFGGNVVMTSPDHLSGTDRCHEALQLAEEEFDAVLNIQGDEPLLPPQMITELVDALKMPGADIATLAHLLEDEKELNDPNRVKVVLDVNGRALYFSRQAVPYYRGEGDWTQNQVYYKHVGLYGYKSKVLSEIADLPQSNLEKSESLEQLRWMENGYSIYCGITELSTPAIDTPEDLESLLNPKG